MCQAESPLSDNFIIHEVTETGAPRTARWTPPQHRGRCSSNEAAHRGAPTPATLTDGYAIHPFSMWTENVAAGLPPLSPEAFRAISADAWALEPAARNDRQWIDRGEAATLIDRLLVKVAW